MPSVSFGVPRIATSAQRVLRVDRVPSVNFGIPRIATCRGCPEGFEGWTGCHPSVSESLELLPAVELQPAAAAQRLLKLSQAAKDGVPVPSVLPWSMRSVAERKRPNAFQACMGPIYSFRRAFSGCQRWCAKAT